MRAKIEERLKKALPVKIAFPAGTIWLPASSLTIDDWLTSIAETDEELRELNIPRIRFLQNHWPLTRLVELEWDDEFTNKRVIAVMYVDQRAYILLSDWNKFQVIAAIEPKDDPSLFQAVVFKILENRSFIRTMPTHIWNRRPDLLPELFGVWHNDFDRKTILHPDLKPDKQWKGFVSHIFVGWIGKWLNTPEMGFWYEDVPQSISRAEKEGNRHEVQADLWRQTTGSSKAGKGTAA